MIRTDSSRGSDGMKSVPLPGHPVMSRMDFHSILLSPRSDMSKERVYVSPWIFKRQNFRWIYRPMCCTSTVKGLSFERPWWAENYKPEQFGTHPTFRIVMIIAQEIQLNTSSHEIDLDEVISPVCEVQLRSVAVGPRGQVNKRHLPWESDVSWELDTAHTSRPDRQRRQNFFLYPIWNVLLPLSSSAKAMLIRP